MENYNSWRLRPPQPPTNNLCPTCSHPHFPFCPPPPYQYFPPPPNQFPPQFHPPPPPHDPYPPPPPPPQLNPNPIPTPPPLLFDNNKRTRFHDSISVSDDQRRLQLIRDHGAPLTNNINTSNNTFRFLPNHNNTNIEVPSFSYSGVKRKFEQPLNVHQHNPNNVEFTTNSFKESGGNRVSSYQGDGRNFPAHGFPISQEQNAPFLNVGPRGGQPPLPNSPPPPLPVELPGFRFPSQYTAVSQPNTMTKQFPNSTTSFTQEIQAVKASSNSPVGETDGFRKRHHSHPSADKPKVIDASLILKYPHRSSRPDHFVVILRGLPGSGKSYVAKFLRDLEIENGGKAPRIHSMDEYFMTEVEKVEESETSGSARGRKQVVKKVMEYCYEPEMEEAYRSSMLKAFKKTLDEGVFAFVIVDDRNLRVADFAQFWATAKRSGYEVYVLEATYKDPAGCAARNVHGFTLTDIQKMANQWEETPSLYMKLDIKSVLHGDDLEENGIEEVDMDTEDDPVGPLAGSEYANFDKVARPSQGVSNVENKWNVVEEHPVEAVKELGKSKWSKDLDEDNIQKTESITGNSSGLIGLIKSHGKKGKPVRWADQVGKIGFSISAGKATNVSLVIGPGSGYNLRSNPLPDEEKLGKRSGEPRRRNIFQEQLRAERESFRAVFDKRKQRISGLHLYND